MNNILRLTASIFFTVCSMVLSRAAYCATPIYQINHVEGTFLQVPLSHTIFEYSKHYGLQDLIVQDVEKKSLPYRLVAASPEARSKDEKLVSDSLRFFPVSPDATPETLRKLHTTQVSSSGNSTKVLTSDKVLNNATPDFYLIDISQVEHDLTGVEVDWIAQPNNQYLEVELEATRDLQNWFSIAKATLVQISQQDESLKRNLIDVQIPKKDFEFLRLSVLRGAEDLEIIHVLGQQKTGNVVTRPAEETWAIKGKLAKTQTTVYLPSSHSKTYPVTAWEFERNDLTPVSTIAIDFGMASYADSAKIFSRDNENQNWRLQQQGIWFNAQIGNQWQKSNPVNIAVARDRFWRIELNAAAKDNIAPDLVLGWVPYQLQIITNNKPPYFLAIESVKNQIDNREQVFNQIISAAKPEWVNAGLRRLEVSPNELAGTQEFIDWKQWIFWVALMLALGVLLTFSLRLFKQLNNAKVD